MTRGAQVLNDMWEKLKAERNDVVNVVDMTLDIIDKYRTGVSE